MNLFQIFTAYTSKPKAIFSWFFIPIKYPIWLPGGHLCSILGFFSNNSETLKEINLCITQFIPPTPKQRSVGFSPLSSLFNFEVFQRQLTNAQINLFLIFTVYTSKPKAPFSWFFALIKCPIWPFFVQYFEFLLIILQCMLFFESFAITSVL